MSKLLCFLILLASSLPAQLTRTEETHAAAKIVWHRLPADHVLDDSYYLDVLPIMDRQLGVAGLRLARFLNDAFASNRWKTTTRW